MRTVHQVPEEDGWSAQAVARVGALPCRPDPASADAEPQPRMNTEEDVEERSSGVNLGQPELAEFRDGPCERRLDVL